MRLLEIFRGVFREDRRRKRPKDFPVLDPAVQNFLHFRTARVGNDASIAQGAWTQFGAALKPTENFSIRDDRGGAARQFLFAQFGDGVAALRQAIRIDRAANFLACIARSPVGMIQHKRARLAKFLMQDVVRGPHREARVPRRRMNVNLLEWCYVKNLPIRHAIESHPTCQAHRLESRSLSKLFQHTEIDFFEARLQRTSEISVPFRERFLRSADWPKALGHFVRKHFAEYRCLIGLGPGHLRARAVMRKVIEPELEAVVVGPAIESHDIAKSVELLGMTVCGEPHYFVFVAEFHESEILRHRTVKQPQRLRKSYHAVNAQAAAAAGSPHRAREIAEPVGGKQRGAFERRNEKAAREMRLVMLDAMKFCRNLFGIGIKDRSQGLRNA